MKTSAPYTLITGASMGLGKAMATECAGRGRNLILVSLPGENLGQLCNEICSAFPVSAVFFECDLADEEALRRLVGEVLAEYSVDQLINNAGIGGTARFMESSPEYLDRIIHLNIRATTMLTRMLLPELITHRRALILNVASIAAFGPLPFKTIYPASKAFIYSFSRSLNRELRKTGVRVAVVTPGPFITNVDVARRIRKQGFLGRIGLLTPGQITRKSFECTDRGKLVIVPGIMNRFNRLLIRYMPESWRLSLMDRVFRRELAA